MIQETWWMYFIHFELTGLNVVTAAALLDTQKGPITGVFHEYAHLGKGRFIHDAGQMEWFNCQVDDRSKFVGGAQRIDTSEGKKMNRPKRKVKWRNQMNKK